MLKKNKEKPRSLLNKEDHGRLNRDSNIQYIGGFFGNIIKPTVNRYFVF